MARNFAVGIFGGIKQQVLLNVAPDSGFGLPPATEPILTIFPLEDAFENGEPDLFKVLRWEYGLVKTLYGRADELASIIRWAESSNRAALARIITGDGGAGKTRLAAAACHELRARRWTAGFLPRADVANLEIGEKGLFLVVDYPEEQIDRTSAILRKISDLKDAAFPIRVLFLSRQTYSAWQPRTEILEGRFGTQAVAAPGALNEDTALALIHEAATRFARAANLNVPDLSSSVEWARRAPVHRLPLYASAAAVHAVIEPSSAFKSPGASVLRQLARRERVRVDGYSRSLGFGDRGLANLLALAVIGDGLDEQRLNRLIEAGAANRPMSDAIECLSQTPWWKGGRLASPEPDFIAAAFLDAALFDEAFPDGRAELPHWLSIACFPEDQD